MDDDCEPFQELISAAIDGELRPEELRQLRGHLDTCRDCRSLATSMGALTVQKPPRFDRNRWLRAALFATGVALLATRLPEVLQPSSGSDVHVARHQAAFVVGLAVVFVYVAWRPDRAYGLLPVTVSLGSVLVIAVLFDVVAGNTRLALEQGHLLELFGLALAGWLGWEIGPGRRSGAGAQSVEHDGGLSGL